MLGADDVLGSECCELTWNSSRPRRLPLAGGLEWELPVDRKDELLTLVSNSGTGDPVIDVRSEGPCIDGDRDPDRRLLAPPWRSLRCDAPAMVVRGRDGDRAGERLLPRVPDTVSGPRAPPVMLRTLAPERRRALVPDARRLDTWMPPRLRLARRDASDPAAPGTPGDGSWRLEYE